MKKLTLLFAIQLIFLLSAFNVFPQFQKLPELLKGTEINEKSATSVLKGNVQVVTVHSPGLEGNILMDSPDRKVSVYLPPGYQSNPQKRYPVLYLYMGYGGMHDTWFGGMDPSYDMSVVLDKLINEGKLNDLIVVSPDNYNKYYGSWFTNSSLAGNWEDFNAIDVVKYIDENFRTIPKPESRGISGYSMGGYGAVKIAMKYPDTFSILYSISGALLDFQYRLINLEEEKNGFTTTAKLSSIKASSFGEFSIAIAFAPDKNAVGYGEMPVDTNGVVIDSVWQKYLVHDLASKIPEYKQNLLKLNKIVLECGTLEPDIYNENNSFSKILNENGINNTLNIHNGDHGFTINNRMGSHVFPFFSKNLQQSVVELKCDVCLNNADSVAAQFNIDGTLFIVPFATENTADAIHLNQLKVCETTAFSEAKLPLSNLENGIYKVVGISAEGYISSPQTFSIVSETPKIMFRVNDLSSGKALNNCTVKVNGESFSTNEQGEINIEGCGKHSLNFDIENYYPEDTIFTFFTDTTIVMTLVHDSYVKLVDRVTGNPLPNISLTYYGTTIKSDSKGFGIVENFRNGTLSYSIPPSARYFAQADTINLNPGDTAVIALTNKVATVQFMVKDETGAVANQKITIDGKEYFSNEEGLVKVTNFKARNVCCYSLENAAYVSIIDSVYIEIDTLVQIMLLSTSAANLETRDFIIFPNPANHEFTIRTKLFENNVIEISTITGRIIYSSRIESTEHKIDLTPFKSGVYFIRLKTSEFTCTKKLIKL